MTWQRGRLPPLCTIVGGIKIAGPEVRPHEHEARDAGTGGRESYGSSYAPLLWSPAAPLGLIPAGPRYAGGLVSGLAALTLFLAQIFGVELSAAQQGTVLLLSVLAGVGTAGVPGGSLPLVAAVLLAVGVPPEGIGIILGVDRLLDMCRTAVNVTGDLAIAVLVDRGVPPPGPPPAAASATPA